ncbi:MAG: DUF4395 domain-containing protein [Sporolactobacillus sp.]
MINKPAFIPRPLVRSNQWIIVLSVAAALITHLYWFLLIPLIAGLSGIAFHYNPVMKVARHFLRKPLSAYIPEDPAQQKFNQTIAVSLLSVSFVSFLAGWQIVAWITAILVGSAAFIAILGFCIGCFIHYQWSQYRYHRQEAEKQ